MAKRTLRPMGYAEILDEVFGLYKQNFLLLIALSAVGPVIGLMEPQDMQGHMRPLHLLLADLLIGSITSGATVYAVSEIYLRRSPNLFSLYAFVLPKVFRLVATFALVLVTFALGLVFLIIPGLVMLVYLSFTCQAVVLEDLAYIPALKRSFNLVRGQWLRVFAVLATAVLISIVIQSAIDIPAGYFTTGEWRYVYRDGGLIYDIACCISTTLTTPILSIASVLIYYDTRVRKEGFDLKLLADDLKRKTPTAG